MTQHSTEQLRMVKELKMKFSIRVLHGLVEVAMIHGQVDINPEDLNAQDSQEIIRCEQKLEKLTGLRFHINAEEVS